MERTSSVVVLVINNKSQFLLFLQARPIREEKLNEVQLFSVKGFIIFRKGDSRVVNACVLQTRWEGRYRGMVQTGKRDRQHGTGTLAHAYSSP